MTDAQLDHIIELFDGVPFLKDQEISQGLKELKQWRKLGREINCHFFDPEKWKDNDMIIAFPKDKALRLKQLLASIEGKE